MKVTRLGSTPALLYPISTLHNFDQQTINLSKLTNPAPAMPEGLFVTKGNIS